MQLTKPKTEAGLLQKPIDSRVMIRYSVARGPVGSVIQGYILLFFFYEIWHQKYTQYSVHIKGNIDEHVILHSIY
jgi:hypothetical protein